jgi:hypothetical protein
MARMAPRNSWPAGLGLGQEQQVITGGAAGMRALGLEQRTDGQQRVPQVAIT